MRRSCRLEPAAHLLLALPLLLALAAPLSGQAWARGWVLPDDVLQPDTYEALVRGNLPIEDRWADIVMALDVVPYHSMHAQEVWRRSMRDGTSLEEALEKHLLLEVSAAEHERVRAVVSPELKRLREAEQALERFEAVRFTRADGAARVRDGIERYLPTSRHGRYVAVYEREFDRLRGQGYEEHWAAIVAYNAALNARIAGEREPLGIDATRPGTLEHMQRIFDHDYSVRLAKLEEGLSPRDRRTAGRFWRALQSEYDLVYRAQRVRSLRRVAGGTELRSLFAAGLFHEARALKRALAANPTSDARHRLALMHWEGLGVRKDRKEAERLLLELVAAGDPAAADDLASLYLDQFDRETNGRRERPLERVVELYRIGAEGGFPRAMMNYGGLHYEGFGVETDFEAARTWFARAAKAGGDPELVRRAEQWAERAAEAERLRRVADARRAREEMLISLKEVPALQLIVMTLTDPGFLSFKAQVQGYLDSVGYEPPPACMAGLRVCRYESTRTDENRPNCGGSFTTGCYRGGFGGATGEWLCDYDGNTYPDWETARAERCPQGTC